MRGEEPRSDCRPPVSLPFTPQSAGGLGPEPLIARSCARLRSVQRWWRGSRRFLHARVQQHRRWKRRGQSARAGGEALEDEAPNDPTADGRLPSSDSLRRLKACWAWTEPPAVSALRFCRHPADFLLAVGEGDWELIVDRIGDGRSGAKRTRRCWGSGRRRWRRSSKNESAPRRTRFNVVLLRAC